MIKATDTYDHQVVFTQQQVVDFARCTGDNNPIHLDAAYAANTPFGRPIVHGFLAGAVFSKVFGTLFPGEGTIYMQQSMCFKAPVFVDRPYTAHFEVKEVDTVRHNATVATTLVDESGNECIVGEARLKHNAQFV